MCTYLASDHSKVNCAINWDRRMRGLLLIYLHSLVFCVYVTQQSVLFISNSSLTSLNYFLNDKICQIIFANEVQTSYDRLLQFLF